MKNIRKIAVFVLVIVILSIIVYTIYSNNSNKISERTEFVLGTFVQIKLFKPYPEELFDEMFSIIKDIENKMSINIENSEVNEINKNAGKSYVQVSPETFFVIEKGKYYSSISNGHFDISIGPLVKLWNIGSDKARVPSQNEIDIALTKIDYNDILLDKSNTSVKLANEEMIIDLGGIAKGYAGDRVAEFLKSKGIDKAIIDLGGNILVIGQKDDSEKWNIGIQNPFESRNKHLGIVKLKDKTIVTSGVYERNFVENGITYHHILNPFTGYPVENSLVGVSIIADNSIDADGLSTSAFSLGIEKGLELINSLDGVDAIFIDNNKNVFITKGLEDSFVLTNEDFNLKDYQ